MPLHLIELGKFDIAFNAIPDELPYLSAASGVGWTGSTLFAVGDDQATLCMSPLHTRDVQQAFDRFEDCNILYAGMARRIIPGALPIDPGLRNKAKPDFEALATITSNDLAKLPSDQFNTNMIAVLSFPHGLLLITGSGGMSRSGNRRSTGVVYPLDAYGAAIGLARDVSFEGLHQFLEQHVAGDLNIEGSTVYGTDLILAQRGNSIDKLTEKPGESMLIRVPLAEVMRSICNDFQVGELPFKPTVASYDLGELTVCPNGVPCQVRLHFTDLATVKNDPYGRLIFTAAAEKLDEPSRGLIAGSAIGLIQADTGKLLSIEPLADPTVKLEGIEAWFNHDRNRIEFLAVDDADDAACKATLRGGVLTNA